MNTFAKIYEVALGTVYLILSIFILWYLYKHCYLVTIWTDPEIIPYLAAFHIFWGETALHFERAAL